jgi:hypothetical protein
LSLKWPLNLSLALSPLIQIDLLRINPYLY